MHRRLLLSAALWYGLIAAPALAQQAEQDQPVLLQADQMTYDEDLGVVTASGNVELAQGERILLADTVSYNQRTSVVTASGNLRMLEPSGEVVFAEYAELTDDLRQGFVEGIRLLMTDNSRLAANSGNRKGGERTELNRAIYSPCQLCKDDPSRAPLWQIKAVKVVHDQQAKDIIYRDAQMEMFGVPVFYTPYFSHPDPTVERRSGFLSPSLGVSSDIGAFFRTNYYFDIAPDMDATLEAGFSEEDGPLLGGEWRQRFEDGRLQLNGAIVRADREETTADGQTITREDRLRGYLFGNGRFDLDDKWRWGFDLERASDNSFLRRYDYSDEDILTSKAFIEGFEDRNYASVRTYGFQDLRPGNLEEEPIVLPLIDAELLGDAGSLWGGRWSLNGGGVGLARDSGTDSGRISGEAGWQRDWTADIGLVTTLSASTRADIYYINDPDDIPDPFTNEEPDDFTARFFPQAQILTRYPFVRDGESMSQFVEPVVSYTLAPNVDNDDIPNEDSRDVELDYTNLFRANRFPGVDRLEGGQRITYGVNGGVYGDWGRTALFLGQSYSFRENEDFPENSGLEDKHSDYVGHLEATVSEYLDLIYDFRLDEDDLSPRRHDLTASAGVSRFRLFGNYFFIDDIANIDEGGEREELTVGAMAQLSEFWSLVLSHRRNLADDESLETGMGLTYEDECFTFQTTVSRDFTEREDLDSGTSVFFRLVFKNLGEVETPAISTDILQDTPSEL